MNVAMASFDEVLDSQRVFRALLNALVRPGRVVSLPNAIPSVPPGVHPRLAQVAVTLLDQEVTFAVAAGDETLANWVARRTGAERTGAASAEFLLADGSRPVQELAVLPAGTLEFPERGATAVLAVACLSGVAADGGKLPAAGGADQPPRAGLALEVSGPGVAVTHRLWVWGLAAENLAVFAERNEAYPLGIDLFLVDAAGWVAGLPRTVRVTWEVLS